MKLWPAMPSVDEIRAASLETCLRVSAGMPSVINVYEVAANVADLYRRNGRGPDAAAVYLVPGRHNPHRTPVPARLVLVAGELVKGGAVRWYDGVVGEILPPSGGRSERDLPPK